MLWAALYKHVIELLVSTMFLPFMSLATEESVQRTNCLSISRANRSQALGHRIRTRRIITDLRSFTFFLVYAAERKF